MNDCFDTTGDIIIYYMVESLPKRPLKIQEIEQVDNTSDSVNISAVGMINPDDDPLEAFVYTILVEDEERYLLGFSEDDDKWIQIWNNEESHLSYETVSEQWLLTKYGNIIDEQFLFDGDRHSS